MTTRREYATSLGLAQPGRGRLSRDALAAVALAEAEGKTFTDSKVGQIQPSQQKSSDSPPVYRIQKSVVQRPSRKLYGLTPEGHTLEFVMCYRCSEHMMYCRCRTLKPPSSVVSGLDGKPFKV